MYIYTYVKHVSSGYRSSFLFERPRDRSLMEACHLYVTLPNFLRYIKENAEMGLSYSFPTYHLQPFSQLTLNLQVCICEFVVIYTKNQSYTDYIFIFERMSVSRKNAIATCSSKIQPYMATLNTHKTPRHPNRVQNLWFSINNFLWWSLRCLSSI